MKGGEALNYPSKFLWPVWQNGTVPLGHRFGCENGLPSFSKLKEKGHLYGGTEPLHPNRPLGKSEEKFT